MRKIIIIISIILVLGIGCFIIFLLPKFNLSDDIETDIKAENNENINIQNELNDLATISNIKKIPFLSKKEKQEKKLTPVEQYEKDYNAKKNKHYGKTNKEINNRRTILNNLIYQIFIDKDWSDAKKTNIQSQDDLSIYYPDYVTTYFIDKYYNKSLEDLYEIEGIISYVSLQEEPEDVYLVANIYRDEEHSYDIYFKTDFVNYKLNDFNYYMTLDNEEEVPLNRLTFLDGIQTLCLKDYYTGRKLNIENIDKILEQLELKNNNYLSENIISYNGLWKNEDGFYYNWEDKYINVSLIVDGKNGNDYEERYTINFEIDKENLYDIVFLIQSKKLIGSSDNREQREKEQLDNFYKEQKQIENKTKKELKEKIDFYSDVERKYKNDKKN